MDYLLYSIIGLCMGVVGGTLGIGGAVFMIPAMTLVFGENQHLYQAAAMICIFFVSSASLIAHRKANLISKKTLWGMVPAALIGIVAGVAMSNSALFEGPKDYILSRVFGGFLVYVAVYNSFRLYRSMKHGQPQDDGQAPETNEAQTSLAWVVGLVTGLGSGLLGMGAGTVATPLQQLLLKSPMKKAMSNSATLIVCISWLGAIYKNLTLPEHGLNPIDSLKIAACIIPGAIIGGTVGGHLMHTLPKNMVRTVFILVCIIAAIKLLTVSPSS
jgi:uncharacterized membrane protein YfcA